MDISCLDSWNGPKEACLETPYCHRRRRVRCPLERLSRGIGIPRLQVSVLSCHRSTTDTSRLAAVGRWPFPDMDDEIDADRLEDTKSHWPMSASPCSHVKGKQDDVCWCKYPQSLYPNWTPRQWEKSKIAKVVEQSTGLCTVHYVDVQQDGRFVSVGAHEVKESNVDEYWGAILREVCSWPCSVYFGANRT